MPLADAMIPGRVSKLAVDGAPWRDSPVTVELWQRMQNRDMND